MKKVKIALFIFILLLLCITSAKAATEDRFTWNCQYEYNDGDKKFGVIYQVYIIPESVMINQNALKQDGNKYVRVYYYSKETAENGKFKRIEKDGTTDFPGHKAFGGTFYPISDIPNTFAEKSFVNKSVSCPTLYISNNCGNSNQYYVTYSDKLGLACPNNKMEYKGRECHRLSDGQYQDGKCDDLISVETMPDAELIRCKYKTESGLSGKTSFTLEYNRTTNTLRFDKSASGDLEGEFQDKSALVEMFKNNKSCPSRVSCAIPSALNWGNTVKIGKNYDGNPGCGDLTDNNGKKIDNITEYIKANRTNNNGGDFEISTKSITCRELLGDSLYKVLHLLITVLQIAGAIIAIISGMLALIPAITSNDSGALKKATTKCIYLAVILVAIGVFRPIIHLIGVIGNFDLSCL